MIVRILSAAKSFAGVHYNERKNNKGKSELLVAENFYGLGNDAKRAEYINYLETVVSTNKRVKNVQFHAVISCKGKEVPHEKLKDYAVQFLGKMGYGENPYLIYAHHDTKNNHVHIVSSRVNKKGKKIDDTYEKIRAQKVMREILNQDLKYQAKKDYDAFKEFDVSTLKQFKLLLEKKGWIVRSGKDNNIELIKDGRVQFEIAQEKIKEVLDKTVGEERKKELDNRKKQLKAILIKYYVSDLEKYSEFLKRKIGVDVVFHTGQGHSVPYGYTVIDYKNKAVFKGSEILKIKEMFSIDETLNARQRVRNAFKSKSKYSAKFQELKDLGATIDKKGNVVLNGVKLYKLNKKDLYNLNLLAKNRMISEFEFSSQAEYELFSEFLGLNIDDSFKKIEKDNLSYYNDMINSYDEHKVNKDKLPENVVLIYKKGEGRFLLDFDKKVFIKLKNQKQKINAGEFHQKNVVDISNGNDKVVSKILAVMNQKFDGVEEYDENKKKKREQQY